MAAVQSRIGAIFAGLFLLLCFAAVRTAYLGVFRAGTLQRAASAQQTSDETVMAQRGAITDRNGVDLAVSEPAKDLAADPYLLHDPLTVAARLAPLLGKPQAELLRKLSQRTGFVYLARGVPAPQAEDVLKLKIEGISGTPVMKRVYPHRTAPGSARRADSADDRREHPATDRRRAQRRRSGVQPERRDGDRDGPAQRCDPGARQLAAGERQRPGGSDARGTSQPRGQLPV